MFGLQPSNILTGHSLVMLKSSATMRFSDFGHNVDNEVTEV